MKRLTILIMVFMLCLTGCAKTDVPDTPEVFETPVDDIAFHRIDKTDVDENRNSKVTLLSDNEREKLGAILASSEWTEATDVPAMGLEPEYLLKSREGDIISLNPWDEERCLVVKTAKNATDNELYYIDPAVYDSFAEFYGELTPLDGVLSPEAEGYMDLFLSDLGFVTLLNYEDNTDGTFSDAQMASYAIYHLENYSYEDGNTREEYDAVTWKHFGRNILEFDNGMTEYIPGTDLVRAVGWSFNNTAYLVLKPETLEWTPDGEFITADFTLYNIDDWFFIENEDESLYANVEENLLTGNVEEYGVADEINIVFKVEYEEDGENMKPYIVYQSALLTNNSRKWE